MRDLFPALQYFEQLTKTNKLARKYGFHPCLCSGPDSLQGIIESMKKKTAFVMVDDTTSQQTFGNGVGFFRRDVYTVFVLMTYRFDDMVEREEHLNICRRLFRQLHSRMLHDRDEMGDERLTFLNLTNIYSTELPRYSYQGLTGLYFMVQNEEPIDISYDTTQWAEP